MSQTFFIADTHFGHNGISDKFRKEFSSDEEHNETIHENILSVSGKRNDLFLLGDIVFKTDHFSKLREYAERFRKVHVILGNHDHPSFAAYACREGIQIHGFLSKYNLWFSHCPIHPDEMYRKAGNVHGHLHTGKVMGYVEEFDINQDPYEDRHYMCISCEQVNYKPITLQSIREEFLSRGITV